MPPWPHRSWSCGGCWTAWKATGSTSSRPSTAEGRPGPSWASRSARPRPGSATGSAWGLAPRPAAPSGRPGPCSAGPLTATAQALTDGELSVAHAQVVAAGTRPLPDQVTMQAEPVLVEAARRLDPPRLRRLLGHLLQLAHPDGTDRDRARRHARRGLWLASTVEGMVAVDGLLEPEAGQQLMAALEPLARPADATDARSGSHRQADALTELARRHLEAGRLPQTGGVRPQLTVTVDLDSLLGHPGTVGGEVGWAGPLDPQACRRLAGAGAVTRVLVTRQPSHHPGHDPSTDQGPTSPAPSDVQGLDPPPAASDPNAQPPPQPHHPSGAPPPQPHDRSGTDRLAARLQAATALLPPILGGAPTQPLEVGRTTRVVQPRPTRRPGRPGPGLCLPRL